MARKLGRTCAFTLKAGLVLRAALIPREGITADHSERGIELNNTVNKVPIESNFIYSRLLRYK